MAARVLVTPGGGGGGKSEYSGDHGPIEGHFSHNKNDEPKIIFTEIRWKPEGLGRETDKYSWMNGTASPLPSD